MKNKKRRPRWLLRILVTLLAISFIPALVLRWVPPPTTTVILHRTLVEDRAQNYHWVPLEDISSHMALAVIAAEDQKFPDHLGFDLQSIRDAVVKNNRGGQLRGASTISQQVARNLFLWQGRSYFRKALEAWMTLVLEISWPKARILEVYLNIAETGPGTFGVEAAAQRFFGKSAATLSKQQSALIAAVLPIPVRMRADRPSLYVLEKSQWILNQMALLGGTDYIADILPSPSE